MINRKPKTRYFVPLLDEEKKIYKMWSVLNGYYYTVYYNEGLKTVNKFKHHDWDLWVRNKEILEISEAEAALLL